MKFFIKLIFLLSISLIAGCGSNSGEADVVGTAKNPTSFFGQQFGDAEEDVVAGLKSSGTYTVSQPKRGGEWPVVLMGKKKSGSVKFRNIDYNEVRFGFVDDKFARVQLIKNYQSKGAVTRFVNKYDAEKGALLAMTDSTRVYRIAGEESLCSISVDIPQSRVALTYTHNEVLLPKSAWTKFVDFMSNPFDNLWSLLVWAVILFIVLIVVKRIGSIQVDDDETEEESEPGVDTESEKN